MERNRAFLVLTVTLGFLLFLQVSGFFSGLNRAVDRALPEGGQVVSLFTETASGVTVLYILVLFLLDVRERRKLSRSTLDLAVAFVFSMLIVVILKVTTNVPRPGLTCDWTLTQRIGHVECFAFPSGHTTRASLLAYFLSRRWKRFWPLWWGWAVAIALSRLLLHVHWFSDVLFGFFLGPWAGLLVELTEGWWLPVYRAVVKKLKLGVLAVE